MAEYRQREATPEEAELLKQADIHPLRVRTVLWYMVCFWQEKPAAPLMIETRRRSDPIGKESRRTHGFNGRGHLPLTDNGTVKVRQCPGRGTDRSFAHWFISAGSGDRWCSRCRGRGRNVGELPAYGIPHWRF